MQLPVPGSQLSQKQENVQASQLCKFSIFLLSLFSLFKSGLFQVLLYTNTSLNNFILRGPPAQVAQARGHHDQEQVCVVERKRKGSSVVHVPWKGLN